MTDIYEQLKQLLEETTRKNKEETDKELHKMWEMWRKGHIVDNNVYFLDKELHLLYVAETWREWHEQMGAFKAKAVRFYSKSLLLF